MRGRLRMPSTADPTSELFEPTESFTILPTEEYVDPIPTLPPFAKQQSFKNVNVVKPVQRKQQDDIKKEFSFKVIASEEEQKGQTRKRKPPDMPVHSQTILDPHFSRNLDLKLRRLKEKEIIAERLSRRSRERQRAIMAEPTVIPKININVGSVQPRLKNVDILKPNVINLEVPQEMTVEPVKSPDKLSPSNPSRSKKGSKTNVAINAGDKPLFITTVRKGEFLPPPANMANLLGMSSCERVGAGAGVPTLIYSYASRPKVVGNTTTRKTSIDESIIIDNAKGGLAHLTSLAMAAAGLAANHRASQSVYGNLMTDKRIVRGSTTAFHGGAENGDDSGAAARGARAVAVRRRAVARRRGAPGVAPWTLTNRKSEPVQTDPYLEELYDKGQEMEVGVQTDLLLERVETPLYIPAKIGTDVSTQIQPGELFDFEVEVEPVLEVLVENTIETALAECVEEEQLARARMQNAAAAEIRVQEQEAAIFRERQMQVIEKEREKASRQSNAENERPDRSATLNLLKEHLSPLLPEVIEPLKVQGLISGNNEEIDETFLPWLMSEVSQEVENMITNRDTLIDIVKEVIETRAELYRAMLDDEAGENTSSNFSGESQEKQDEKKEAD